MMSSALLAKTPSFYHREISRTVGFFSIMWGAAAFAIWRVPSLVFGSPPGPPLLRGLLVIGLLLIAWWVIKAVGGLMMRRTQKSLCQGEALAASVESCTAELGVEGITVSSGAGWTFLRWGSMRSLAKDEAYFQYQQNAMHALSIPIRAFETAALADAWWAESQRRHGLAQPKSPPVVAGPVGHKAR